MPAKTPNADLVTVVENRTEQPLTLDLRSAKIPGVSDIEFGCAGDRLATDGRPNPIQNIPQPVWEAAYKLHGPAIDRLIELGHLTVH